MLESLRPTVRFAGGIFVGHFRLAPGTRIDNHRHDLPTLVAIHRGAIHIRELDASRVESAGTLTQRRGGAAFSITAGSDGADCWAITTERGHPVGSHASWRGGRVRQWSMGELGARWTDLEIAIAAGDAASLNVESALLAILSAPYPPNDNNSRPPWLTHAIEHLRDVAPARRFSRSAAAAVGVHPVHLARVVRLHLGLSMRQYVARRRIELSERLLRSSLMSISRVAAESGYADQSHLCREFRRYVGLTPSAYRQALSHRRVSTIQVESMPGAHLGTLRSVAGATPHSTQEPNGDLDLDST